MVASLPILEAPSKHVCEGCILGKMQCSSFPKDGSVRATRKLQLIHSDVCGPMQTPSFGNHFYFVTFIDGLLKACMGISIEGKVRSVFVLQTVFAYG